jgi:GT2 family glycosyltransferase/SAM-dependent methyltransferase/glycosyltransferase involved in cell wall biosynthesis
MPPRRAGAPRLIDWTGERCVPWASDVQVVYEHYHRYLWARALATGRRVLDLGSGEGFGAALLADTAQSVTGIDVDERTVQHSRLNYAGGNLEFRTASATDLADFADDSFDLAVAFEIVEHVRDQAALMSEVARVLAPGGVLVMSTPDRRAYAANGPNPFHERELTVDEFSALLQGHFSSVTLFSQRTATGSRIQALDAPGATGYLAVQLERAGDEWREAGPPSPLYVVGVATDGAMPELPADSTLSDFDRGLLRAADRDAAIARGERDEARGAEASERQAAIREQQAATQARAERDGLVSQLLDRTRALEEAGRESEELRALTRRVSESVVWNTFQRVRARVYRALGGEGSPAASLLGAALRRFGRSPASGGHSFAPVIFPRFERPVASIVIPVHSGAALTERCLRAILAAGGKVPYEVIVVDDAADAETKALLAATDGVHVLVNERNLNFLRSVNRGADEAAGRFIVLLNNDTEPQPGWLDALVECADSADDVGIVAAKLVYPNGILQEAGGIVWQDGTAWNYGRGNDPSHPRYNFMREVDYGSAAALLVRADLWRELGGFDEQFAPGYWEDTDICFAARAAGRRVVYEPAATVVHLEGSSLGTDVTAVDSGKHHQELNAPKFAAKWRDALRDQLPQPSVARAVLAADRNRGEHVLVVDHRVPTPDRDSGSVRMEQMLLNLRTLGYRVSFLPDDANAPEPYTSHLQRQGIEVLYGPILLPEIMSAFGPRLRLAILSRPYVAPRYVHWVREFAPRARLAYDTVDLHYLRERRRALQDDTADPRISEGFMHLELALAHACDVTLVVSEDERLELAAAAPDLAVEVVPNANPLSPHVRGPEGRSGLLFVGGFQHPPNIDAAVHLVRVIMPRVWRQIGDVPLTIVGSHAPPEVLALASPAVHVAGWVEDLAPLLDGSRAMVAPLRYGAGMKGKVTQSLAAGLPVVTSSIGAEGLDAVAGQHLLLGDDPDALTARIVELCRDDELWATLSEGGRALVERCCSPSVQRAALERLAAAPEPVAGLPVP